MSYSKNNFGPVAIIGAGRVGRALSQALHKQGITISAVISRSLDLAERCAKASNCAIFSEQLFDLPDLTKIIFITTPDKALSQITRNIAKLNFNFKNKFAAHTSGAMTSEVLEPLRKQGALVASFHPIQTFAGDDFDLEKFSGIYFGLEGDEEALNVCKNIVKLFDGKYIIIPKDIKSLYHTACVFTSNYLIALLDFSIQLLSSFNLTREQSAQILLPLLEGTVENIKKMGIETSLTGPISRGDFQTVQKHVETIKNNNPEILPFYCLLGKKVLNMTEKRGGIDSLAFKKIQAILEWK
ncbi:MAG: Rossmann-like and DUF2520 domain-containing protein [bacterium]